jgi:general secretion pathway protein B
MSFILDALKKSENDRQRQSGPALFEVRVPPPRSKFPLLAVAIVALLVVNVGVVAWLMLRKPADAAVPPSQVAAAPQPQYNTQQPAPGPQAMPPSMSQQPGQPQAGYPTTNYPPAGYPPASANAPPPAYGATPPAYGATPPAYGPPGSAPNPGAYPQQQPAPGGYAQPNTAGQGAYPTSPLAEPQLSDESSSDLNPDDYEPAREPAPGGLFGGSAKRSTDSGLPTYEEAAGKANLPPLHLDLHSYAPDPSKRFVLINMKRLYEGQSNSEGVKVESITTDAAIMSYQGTKFVLDRD